MEAKKRNPYLVEYEEQIRLRSLGRQGRGRRDTGHSTERQSRRTKDSRQIQLIMNGSRPVSYQNSPRRRREYQSDHRQPADSQLVKYRVVPQQMPPQRRAVTVQNSGKPSRNGSRASAVRARRRAVRRQRLAVGVWALCILVIAASVLIRNHRVSAAQQEEQSQVSNIMNDTDLDQSDTGLAVMQGLPVTVFTSHPSWEEKLLTPNEYSRPGDPLGEVTNIFVHYTANPGTSAAQNRSYFEQQKDTHESSVSAHFIIGYEGEILQCVPLDEIAYAVQTRNQDSISIECCYLAENGAFTQETYDSLIRLLAWLTQAYDLDTEDILRHYDCGGKKCPLYYTEHEEAWEQLKEDVAEKIAENSLV